MRAGATRTARTPARSGTASVTWRRYLLAGAGGILGYFLLPSATWQNVAFITSNLVAFTAVVVGIRRHRPRSRACWLLLAAFPALTGAGNMVWLVNDSLRHVNPFPSWGDASFLSGYLLLAAGLLGMVRARAPGRDWPSGIDAAILTTGFAVASWVFLMGPLLRDQESTSAARLTALGYPVGNVLVLAVGARLFTGPAARGGAYRLLGANLAVQLVADTVFAVLNLLGRYGTGHPIDALILAYNLGWGAVALHPDMRGLTVRSPQAPGTFGPARLALLTLASLAAPGVLVVQVLTDYRQDQLVTAGGAVTLFLLVVARMAWLVRALELNLRERRALEAELHHRAHHDALTALANRALFAERVTRALGSSGCTAVLFVDLDDFKGVNDRFGHAAGDALLVEVAGRLRAAVREGDTVARLGGDEFAVLLDHLDEPGEAEATAGRVLAALRAPVALPGGDVPVHASVGVAVGCAGETLDEVLARADAAMYAAKGAGKGRHHLHGAGAVTGRPGGELVRHG